MRNELFGWLWIVAGFASGAVLGMFFHRAEFLGGYDSYRRRLIRLGHISFLGLGILNILFALSIGRAKLQAWESETASWAMIVGGITMPLSCALNAWRPSLKPVFAIPVTSLLVGGITLVRGLIAA